MYHCSDVERSIYEMKFVVSLIEFLEVQPKLDQNWILITQNCMNGWMNALGNFQTNQLFQIQNRKKFSGNMKIFMHWSVF